MKVTLDQLQVLDAIDRHRSFAGAAAELCRATSAVSYAVKSLEGALEVELFDRSGHRAHLTAAGRAVLREGRALLDGARRIEALASRLRQDWEPRLGVVMDGVLPIEPVIRALNRFTRQELPTTLDLRVEYLSRVRERFERESLDLMLALDEVVAPELAERRWRPFEMVLVAHRDHPLAASKDPLPREAFAGHVELLVSPSAGAHMQHIHRMYLGGAHRFELSDFHSKRAALLAGVGFGWMPRHLVEDALGAGALVVLALAEGGTMPFTPRLVHRKDGPLGRGARLLLEYLDEEARR